MVSEYYLCFGLFSLLFQLGIDLLEKLDRFAQPVRLSEVRAKVQLALSDVIVPLEKVSIPKLRSTMSLLHDAFQTIELLY